MTRLNGLTALEQRWLNDENNPAILMAGLNEEDWWAKDRSTR